MTDNEKNLAIIKGLYNWILASSLFRTNGHNFDTIEHLDFHIAVRKICSKLGALETDCDVWLYFGDDSEASGLPDFIAAAYWACADCHGGQESETYATMCALGTIFKPGMTSLNDDPESSEKFAYDRICEYLLR